MPVKVGLVGFGMIGTIHFKAYQSLKTAQLVAVCDSNPERVANSWAGIKGDIETSSANQLDLSRIRKYDEFAKLISDADIDVVDICVPTFLHSKLSIAALDMGKHVICEKPMARDSTQCYEMIKAAKRSGRLLMVGHVIRFWPGYVALKEIIDSGRYGKVRSMVLRRLSGSPGWTKDNWFLDAAKGGHAGFDLHIHDTDAIQWFLGLPSDVISYGVMEEGAAVSHIITHYGYEGVPLVMAEAVWYDKSFPFSMSATIHFESATAVYNSAQTPSLVIHEGSDIIIPELTESDPYAEELGYFIEQITEGTVPPRLTPEDAARSVSIVEAEIESVRSGSAVKLNF